MRTLTARAVFIALALVAALVIANPGEAQHIRGRAPSSVHIQPRVGIGFGVSAYRPYYAFRPRVSIGFGFYAGYPVRYPYGYFYGYPYSSYGYYGAPYSYPYSYPYAYPYSYPYSSGYSYGYGSTYPPAYGSTYPQTYGSYPPAGTSAPAPSAGQPSNSILTAPGANDVAGLSFDVTPGGAAVFIDNVYVGQASKFTSTQPPLNLASGQHHVEIRAEGYQSMSFDVDAKAGEVVPYQGSLQPIK